MTAIDRRRALSGTAAIAVGLPVLAACGGDDTNAVDPSASTKPGVAGETLASTSDVPVGGCFVVAAAKVVVTQPTEGDFKAFSAVCTHQGCIVDSGTDGEIRCPCHGSRFSLEDGAPTSGPASSPLSAVEVTVDGDSIILA